MLLISIHKCVDAEGSPEQYFAKVKMKGLEAVYFICVDLAGSEGQTALGTQDEFCNGQVKVFVLNFHVTHPNEQLLSILSYFALIDSSWR